MDRQMGKQSEPRLEIRGNTNIVSDLAIVPTLEQTYAGIILFEQTSQLAAFPYEYELQEYIDIRCSTKSRLPKTLVCERDLGDVCRGS